MYSNDSGVFAVATAAFVGVCALCSRSALAPVAELEPDTETEAKPELSAEQQQSTCGVVVQETVRKPDSQSSPVENRESRQVPDLHLEPHTQSEPTQSLQSSDQLLQPEQNGPTYVPLPAGPPQRERLQSAPSKQGGATAAARRLRASRAGRVSTANYRPFPPTTAFATTVMKQGAVGSPPRNVDEHSQSEPHSVRFGDILGLHCNEGQLTALSPANQTPSSTFTAWASTRWQIAKAPGAADADRTHDDRGEFEIHPSGEWSKQRAFSGAVRQVLGHRSVMDVESGDEILDAVDSLPPGRVSPEARDTLQRKLRFAQAEARANSTQSAVALLEHACVENGCRVQLKHVHTGRWLACKIDTTRHGSVGVTDRADASSRTIAAQKVLQLLNTADESCRWTLWNSAGVGVGGMLSYNGQNSVYLSPSATALTNCASCRAAIISPPSTPTAQVADGELQLSVTTVYHTEFAMVAEAAVAAGASGWELRPYSQPSPLRVVDKEGTGTNKSMDTVVPAFPTELRKERVLEYDAHRYPFREVLTKILCSELAVSSSSQAYGDCDLGKLHESHEGRQFVRRSPKGNARNPYDRKYKAMHQTLREEYLALYTRFLREVVWPALGCDPQGLVYQSLPTFRCHLPGTGRPLIRKHNDAEYFHQPNEINVWLPVTNTFGSNTLWSESSPGTGDFHPFECEGGNKTKGQCVLFWGNACYHHTLPNDTDTTRVSVDFRVIPRSYYQTVYKDCLRMDGQPRFSLGAYYQETGPIAGSAAQ